VPPEIDVRSIRSKLRLSQEDFARIFGFTIDQIKAWEQGRNRPLGGVRAYLMIMTATQTQSSRFCRGPRDARWRENKRGDPKAAP
jgi:DNA-binding transcriptional regulator YiaG